MKLFVPVLLRPFLLALVIGLAGCGSSTTIMKPAVVPPLISATAPPAATVESAYNFTFTVASGGVAPFTWSESGALPPGLVFNAGTLSGAALRAGTYPITVTVTDSFSPPQTASQQFTLVANNPTPPIVAVQILVVSSGSIPGCPAGSACPISSLLPIDQGQSLNFMANVQNDPSIQGVTWNLSGPGTLTNVQAYSVTYNAPPSVGPNSPAAALTATSVADPRVSSSNSPTITLSPAPMIAASSLPGGSAGTYYSANVSGTGGAIPLAVALTSGGLPPGLQLSNFYSTASISGQPAGPPQTSSFTLTVSDGSFAGPVSSSSNLQITIGPVLPLTINTTPPLADGVVGMNYSAEVDVTGGFYPYTYTLAPGSAALPAGLTLSTPMQPTNPLFISGVPLVAGTTADIDVVVTDSQSPPVTATMTYSLTLAPSTFFVGTQAPGDIYQMAIQDATPTDGMLNFQNQGTKGLTSPLNGGNSGTFSAVAAGFRKFVYPYPNGLPVPNYLVEIPGALAFLIPTVVTFFDAPGSPGLAPGNVIAATANACPSLPAPVNFQFVALADEDFDLTKDAYGIAAVTQIAANTYNLAFNSFKLDGSPGTSTTFPGINCDSNLEVLSSSNAAGITTTIAISSSGLMAIDNGTGIPAFGVQQPPADLSTTAILAGQYLGAVFYANDSFITVVCRPPPIGCQGYPGPTSAAVGFGPGSATSISGGAYNNVDTDAFSAHGTDHVITLGTQTSPGLFPGGTLTIGFKTLADFDVAVGQVNGKFVLLGVTLDSTASPIQPYVVLLIQQ